MLLEVAKMDYQTDRLGNRVKPIRQMKKAARMSGRQWKKYIRAAKAAFQEAYGSA